MIIDSASMAASSRLGATLLILLGLVSGLPLTGCASPPPPHRLPYNPCEVSLAQFAVGQVYDPALGAQAMKAAHAGRLTVVVRDGIDLSDYGTHRLKIYLDAAGRVEGLSCG
jgi:hypothetical protein